MQPILFPSITVFGVEITAGPAYADNAVPDGTPVLPSSGKPAIDPEFGGGEGGVGAVGVDGVAGEGGEGDDCGGGLDPGGVGFAPVGGSGADAPGPGTELVRLHPCRASRWLRGRRPTRA